MSINSKITYTLTLIFSIIFSCLFVYDKFNEENIKWDFLTFYLSGRAADADSTLYDYRVLQSLIDKNDSQLNKLEVPVLPYLYPPPLAYSLIPISKMSYRKASLYWTTLGFLAFNATIYICLLIFIEIYANSNSNIKVNLFSYNKIEIKYFIYLILLIINFITSFIFLFRLNISLGQVNVFVLFFISLAVFNSLKSNQMASGLFLSLAIMLKVTPIFVLIWFIAKKQYKALYWTFISLFLIFIVSLSCGSFYNWLNFFDFLPQITHGAYANGFNQNILNANFSFAGILSKLLGINLLSVKVISILLMFFLYYLMYKQISKSNNQDILFFNLSILMIITAPIAYKHHIIFLMPGSAIVLANILTSNNKRIQLTIIVFFYLLISLSGRYASIIDISEKEILMQYSSSIYLVLLILLYYFINVIIKQKNELNPDFLNKEET